MLLGKRDDGRGGRHRHRNDGRKQHVRIVREHPRQLEGENEEIGERRGEREADERGNVDVPVAEELFGGELRHSYAHDEHRKRRRHVARIGDDLLEFRDRVHVEDVDLGHQKEDKAHDRAHRAGVQERLFEGDLLLVLRDEVGAERPDKDIERNVEYGEIHHRLGVSAREHIHEGNAHERAVGEGADEYQDVALPAFLFALLVEKDELTCKERQKERREREEEHP